MSDSVNTFNLSNAFAISSDEWTRFVILKWWVPSTCPNPEPGTIMMPVSSSTSKQYFKSGDRFSFCASSMYPWGSLMRGKTYIAPSTSLQVIPWIELSFDVKSFARSLRPWRTSLSSCWYWLTISWEAVSRFGGLT